MSKIGKTNSFFSKGGLETAKLNAVFKKLKAEKRITFTSFTEDYNSQAFNYSGKITLSGYRLPAWKVTDSGAQSTYLDMILMAAAEIDADHRAAVSSILNGALVENTVFDTQAHYEELLELPKHPEVDSLSLYKFRCALEYNFLIKNYENFLNADTGISELALPYFYNVLSEHVQTDSFQGFEGTSFFDKPEEVITGAESEKTNIIPFSVIVKNKKLRIDKYLDMFNGFKEQFPFYADIVFDTHELSSRSIIGALEDKDLATGLLKSISDNTATNKLALVTTETGKTKSGRASFGGLGSKLVSKTVVLGEPTLRKHNVENYLMNIFKTSAQTDFSFIFDMNQRIDSKIRTFKEVLEGKKEYTEVIGYRLSKYLGNTNSLIQEWYLPNVGESKISWVDSQIKYDKLYTYKLEPIVLTFGTEYRFTNITSTPSRMDIEYENRPVLDVYIINDMAEAIDLGPSYTNRLLDYPPMEPEMELIPFIGVPDLIKINFNTSTGLKTVPAINFDVVEEEQRDRLRLAQNKDVDSPLLTFQTDEPSVFFEFYRIDIKPKSYSDFFGRRVEKIPTDNASSAAFLDTVQPNKKYYYTARSIDFHGNISNPAPVLELEIVEDNGLILPLINLVEFEKDEIFKQPSKEFRKYLKIRPAIRHRLTNAEKTNENNIELGSDAVTPWEKRFVLRLTSKSTGKKMDIRLKFKYNKPQ